MATTKEEVREKVVSMIENDLPNILINKLDYLLDSGAINFDNEENTWKLPKHIMVALAHTMERLYSNPHATRSDKKQIKNFNYFI